MFRLLDLPEEIISVHLVPVLDASDIKSLFLTCRQLYLIMNQQIVWHTLFIKTFGDVPVPFETIHKWPQLYKLRNHSNLYAWGETAGGRLGMPLAEIKESLIIRSTSRELGHHVYAANIPLLMERFRGKTAVDIAGAGFFFSILTESGEIYNTGIGGTARPDVRSFEVPENERIRQTNTGGHSAPVLNSVLSKLITDPGDIQFVSVSAGRNHTLALDNDNNLWVWDCRKQQTKGIKMKFGPDFLTGLNPSATTSNINILMIRSGWNYNSCLIHGIGIMVWFSRLSYGDNFEAEFGRDAVIIPNTNGSVNDDLSSHVVDYAALDNSLVFVNGLGRAYKVDFENRQISDIYQLAGFQSSLKRQWKDAKFVRVNGSYKSFALMSNGDNVFLGETQTKEKSTPIILPELQYKGCISIVFGDYHKLALFKNGDLYSWGRDSQMCGCTCLGTLSNDELKNVSHIAGHDRVVPNPVKVPLKGKVLAISAGGWQSAALIAEAET